MLQAPCSKHLGRKRGVEREKEVKRFNTLFYLAVSGAFPVGCDFLECSTIKGTNILLSPLAHRLRVSGRKQGRHMDELLGGATCVQVSA